MEIPVKKIIAVPRLPLEGSIDLTYRCNNHCLHCWLWAPDQEDLRNNELTFDQIRIIADEARNMGCRYWSISGGEPMLRRDFPDIFDYLTHKTIGYTLNTNGTLITPAIARKLKRKGSKLIALYGATAEIHDHVTRHSGSFEQLMQGFAYLKEANVGFTVQLIPMQANWHQWDQMVALANSISPLWRIGAPWLNLSGDGSPVSNRNIEAQRLSPRQVVELERPYPSPENAKLDPSAINDSFGCSNAEEIISVTLAVEPHGGRIQAVDDRLFASCIEERRDFHIDPYGQMTWCSYVKDPSLRYDLLNGTFQEAWDIFIPSCADKIRGGREWQENCGSCEKRRDCQLCAVHAYLETGRYSAPVPYLCAIADEAVKYKEKWQKNNRRYFQIAGITVCLESDLSFENIKFNNELNIYTVEGPVKDMITLRHQFELPDLSGKDLGRELDSEPPWVVSFKDGAWFYKCLKNDREGGQTNQLAIFNEQHTDGIIYSSPLVKKNIIENGWPSLSLLPTDQIWLVPYLLNHKALLLKSATSIINGRGLLFIESSDRGGSVLADMLNVAKKEKKLDAEILSNDRIIIRYWPDSWCVYGTGSHSDSSITSPRSAPLHAIIYLDQTNINEIDSLTDRSKIRELLLSTLIRPMVKNRWEEQEFDILEQLVADLDCYRLQFNKPGAIRPMLERLTS